MKMQNITFGFIREKAQPVYFYLNDDHFRNQSVLSRFPITR